MAADLDSLLVQLRSANGFDELARLSSNRSWVSYLPNLEREQERQSIYQWLLTPNEGHGQGDYFIRRLLQAAFAQADAEFWKKIDENDVVSHYPKNESDRLRYLTASYDTAVVAQELACLTPTGNYRYIDLLVADPVNRVCLLIERKDGSQCHNDQLSDYRKYIFEHFDYAIFPILIDSAGGWHDSAPPNGFVQLDDSWLVDAVDELLESRHIDQEQRANFSTLLNYVFAPEWKGSREAFYSDWSKKFNAFAEANAELLGELFNSEVEHKPGRGEETLSFGDAEYHDLVRAIGSVSGESRLPGVASAHMHAKHYDLLWELSGFNALTPVARAISATWDDIYAQAYIDDGNARLEITCHLGWNGYDPESGMWWPYWIAVTQEPREANDDRGSKIVSCKSIRRYKFRVGSQRRCPSDLIPLAQRFAEEWGMNNLNNEGWKQRTKVYQADVDDLRVEPGCPLHSLIEEFRHCVRRIVKEEAGF